MENTNYYEPRYVSQSIGNNIYWFGEENSSKTLSEEIFENDKIVLLGNPGSGKTKELEILFEKLWSDKEFTGIIPFSINLKNFRKINIFEDLINYPEWKSLPSIIFILDGLDEIAEINDFISAFELFITQNTLSNFRYVISCRTNIYEKYLVNISNFATFYLQDLSLEQSSSLLKKKYGIEIESYNYSNQHLNYLKTPFFLELFANYISEQGVLPSSDASMWDRFIKISLSEHEKKQSKKERIDTVKIIKNLKKVAFTNEMMQQNYSTAEELDAITGNYVEYIDNPFTIELTGEPVRWNFIHRQIQEYLVALTLSEKDFKEILSVIKVPNIDRDVIHPSLFNIVTFLINILDQKSENFQNIIRWLTENQIEILLKADSDRTSNFKEFVFQSYFKVQCIDKKLWISTNKAFSVKEIADFGDSDANFNYLLNFIKDKNEHYRVIISALNLLSFFKPTFTRSEIIKPLFLDLLNCEKFSYSVKSEIIHCITLYKLCKTDQNYLDKVLSIFKNDTNKELNSALLLLIIDIKDIDRFFWYIKEEFLREAKISNRIEVDEVHRGNEWKLQEIILKLENSNNFIELITYYFVERQMLNLYSDYSIKIKERCLHFCNSENDFIIRLLQSINVNNNFYNHDNLLIEIITSCKKEIEATKYLMENNSFSAVRNFLSHFAEPQTLELVSDHYKRNVIKDEDIFYFRNNLSHYKFDLAVEFEKLMSSDGFVFESLLPKKEEIDQQKKENTANTQENFDLLFDKGKLLEKINKIFSDNQTDVLGESKIYDIGSLWRKEKNYPAYFDSSLSILQYLVEKDGSISFQKVQDYLEDKNFLLRVILNNLQSNGQKSSSFIVRDVQSAEIIQWSQSEAKKIDFNEIVELIDQETFKYKKDFDSLELILSFQKIFHFDLPKDFLLQCLEFYEMDDFSDNEDSFTYIFEQVQDKELFDNKIIENIQNKILFKSILDRHVDYSLKNNLKETFPKIREYFLNLAPGYNLDAKLEMYLSQSSDIDLLKECCTNINSPKCWSAIKLLALNKQRDFCVEKAEEYLAQDEDHRKDYYTSNAMWVLFHFNDIKAIDYYLLLKNFDFYTINFSDYSAIRDFEVLETLFNRIFQEIADQSDYSHGSSFFYSYIANLSKISDDFYHKTQETLQQIRRKLIDESSDIRLFSINLLIDNSKNSYINSKSIPLKFKEALKLAEVAVNN